MWCKERGIRLSGVPLGRPPKDVEKNRARRRQIREDEGIRNAVEGKLGQGAPGDRQEVKGESPCSGRTSDPHWPRVMWVRP